MPSHYKKKGKAKWGEARYYKHSDMDETVAMMLCVSTTVVSLVACFFVRREFEAELCHLPAISAEPLVSPVSLALATIEH